MIWDVIEIIDICIVLHYSVSGEIKQETDRLFSEITDKNRENDSLKFCGKYRRKRSTTALMLFSTSDKLSKKLEGHFRENAEEGYPLCLSPTAAARFLTGAMAQSARYLIEHREDPAKEDLPANMNVLIAKIFEA